MEALLILSVVLLSFANGANDNFKGVATIWGAGRASYTCALAFATVFTALGSLAAFWGAAALAGKFNGSQLVGPEIHAQTSFLAAVAIGAATSVLLASGLGLPVSTTHAMAGALVGVALIAAGTGEVKLVALTSGVLLPLLLSPVVALALTVAASPMLAKLARSRDCLCVEEPPAVQLAPAGNAGADVLLSASRVRWANARTCQTGKETIRFSAGDALHWLSAAGICFARGLNDAPKIAGVLFVAAAGKRDFIFLMIAAAMALGGALGSARVAQTMSKKITPMATEEAVAANLVAAGLVTLASFFALPVSTTHVTSGGIFGIGWMRRGEADWQRVRAILHAWVGTLPLSASLAAGVFLLLMK